MGTFAQLAADLDPPAMIRDDAVNDRQSEPGALTYLFCRKEGLEYPILCLGIHTATGIGNPQANKIAAMVEM